MEIKIVTECDRSTTDELSDLRGWLLQEDELRGRVQMVDRPVQPGHLGGLPELLVVTLGPGGAATVLVGAIVAWLRYRTADITVRITRTRSGKSLEISANRIWEMDNINLEEFVREVNRCIEETSEEEKIDQPEPEVGEDQK